MKKINLNIYKKNYNNYNKNWGGIIRLHSTNNRFFLYKKRGELSSNSLGKKSRRTKKEIIFRERERGKESHYI